MKSYKCNFTMNRLIANKNHASKYHIESINFFADPKLAPITEVREYYNDYEKAMMAIHIIASSIPMTAKNSWMSSAQKLI